ncbi:MAG: hypothetical protein JOZ41_12945 [Chloroflexi bacterium]|nr:hypothetical protein [Chloroflexota bacterium]
MKRQGLAMIVRDRSPHPTKSGRKRLPGWLIVLQLALAYQWGVSGINKLLDPHFGTQLVPVLRGSTQGNPYGWYATFLRVVVLPNHALFAPAVQVLEPAIGLALLLGAGLWVVRPRGPLTTYGGLVATAALLGSIGLSLNYFFQGGTPLPWIDAGNALNPGVDINVLTALVSVVLLGANLSALLAARGTPVAPSRAEGDAA